MFADMPLEARVYGLLFAVALILASMLIFALSRADKRADNEEEDRKAAEGDVKSWRRRAKAAEAELAGMRRRYSADVNEHFDRSPRWTRPGPPADQTVIMTSLAETVILTTSGVSLADPT